MMLPASAAVLLAIVMSGPVLERQAAAPPSAAEVIADVLVHGNDLTPDADVTRIAGVHVGDAFTAQTIADVRARLEAAGRFEDIQVLKRFASIADASRVAIVIIVNEGPVKVELTHAGPGSPPTRVVKRSSFTNVLFLPILDAEDGYGLTYGARFAYVKPAGKHSRLSFPLTWGGLKQAGVEFERTFTRGPISRVAAGSSVDRQRNPAYDENDNRRRVWARAERALGPLRGGGEIGWQHISFAGSDDDVRSVGADIAFDTRLDPVLPRNAVYLRAGWTRLDFASGGATDRTDLEARGYLGLVGQTVLVARVLRDDPNRPLPAYFKSLLGGWSSVRGFQAGAFVGDTLVTGSLELIVPLSSPLKTARVGLSVFADAGKAYDKGQRFADEPTRTGLGAGVWLAAAALRVGCSVAHGLGAGTRVTFSGGVVY